MENKEHFKEVRSQLDEKYAEMRQIKLRERAIHHREQEKLIPYLEIFYKDRFVSYDRKLSLRLIGGARTRLENQAAADFYTFADPETQQHKLAECREEFQAFAEFLKAIYLSKKVQQTTGA